MGHEVLGQWSGELDWWVHKANVERSEEFKTNCARSSICQGSRPSDPPLPEEHMKMFIVITSLILAQPAKFGPGYIRKLWRGCSGSKRQLQQKKLLLHWRVNQQRGKNYLRVTTTFLKGPAARIRRGRLRSPNASHVAQGEDPAWGANLFIRRRNLETSLPVAPFEGTLQDGQVCSQLTAPKPRGVALDVAYGFDVAAIKKSLRAVAESNEHPANPIVDWRTLRPQQADSFAAH